MDGTWSQAAEGVEVGGGAVAFIGDKIVAGVQTGYLGHPFVPGGLSKDGCGGNGKAACVSFDDWGLRDATARKMEEIDQQMIGGLLELFQCPCNSQAGSRDDPKLIDLCVGCEPNRPADAV